MLRVWLHGPCRCDVPCCKSSRRRRKVCFVRRSHVLACFCSSGLVLYALFLLQLDTAYKEHWLAGSWSAVQLPVSAHTPEKPDALKKQRSVDLQAEKKSKPLPVQEVTTAGPASIVAPTTPAPSSWRLPLDWQKTQLGPGFPDEIDSAWSDISVLESGDVLRIEAEGFNSKDSPIAVWGWYLNVWKGDGRNWVTKKGNSEPSRLLHFNPRPRGGGYIAINNFLKGTGWGKEKDVPIPEPWKMENAQKSFVLELELGEEAWLVKLNGRQQPEMSYKREGDYREPLILQLYDLINPSVTLKKRGIADSCAVGVMLLAL